MKNKYAIILLSALSFSFTLGCGRPEDCDLNSLNLKGDVKSVEIITQTPIPISEWLYANRSFGSYETTWAPSRSYSFIGNSILVFNRRGNIQRNIVFDSEGNLIASERPNQHPTSLYKHFAIEVHELYSTVTTKKDDKGRIIDEIYNEKGIDRYKRSITYNENGDIDLVTCNYTLLTIDTYGYKKESTDTIRFHYVEYDNHNNWTKALVAFNGFLNQNDYVMTVYRQINYFGESTVNPLIGSLDDLNNRDRLEYKEPIVEYNRITPAKNGLSIDMPTSFEVFEQSIKGQNMFQYSAENIDGYFSFIVQYFDSAEDLVESYDSLSDKEYEETVRASLELGGIQIISWNGRKKVTVNGRKGLWCSYYHYPTAGLGGSPVKVEIYQFQDTNTGIIVTLTIGYDSAHTYEFEPQIDHMIKSISF